MPVGPGHGGVRGHDGTVPAATAIVSEDPTAPGGPSSLRPGVTHSKNEWHSPKVPGDGNPDTVDEAAPYTPHMEPISLTTERLLLRPFVPSDVTALQAACQDPDISRYTNVPSPYTLEHARTFIEERCVDGWRDDSVYAFGLFSREDGRLVGSMALVRLQLPGPERQAELGYWTAKEARGRGYTVEAAREVIRWAFEDLGIERMEWYAEAGNEGSRAVALKVGFRMEGTMRAKIPYAGTRRDAWVGALLPSDLGLPTPAPYLPYPERG